MSMSVIDAIGSLSFVQGLERSPPVKVGADDFQLLRVLGQGGYGKVGNAASSLHQCVIAMWRRCFW